MTGRDEYLEPSSSAEAELKEKRSLFVGRVFRAADEFEARDLVRSVSRQYSDATHNCWAYRVGFPQTVEYYSDSGEPSGTAGKPIMGAILRAGLVNVTVIVTRYYGGIKLGVRGLISAYGSCASLALEKAGQRSRVRSRAAFLECSYEHAQAVIRHMADIGIPEDEIIPEWGTRVGLRASVPWSLSEKAESLFRGYRERGSILTWKWEE